MPYIVIADCGSTKVHWAILAGQENKSSHRTSPQTTHASIVDEFHTTGFNAAVTPPEEISRLLDAEVAPHLPLSDRITELHFYGAGCIGGETDRRLSKLLSAIFPGTVTEISSDLLGAARALFGTRPGIACILGTGSNSGLYDGTSIIANTPPLGFILGDEGSGAVLGRRLVSDIYKGLLPEEITADFLATYNISKAGLIGKVYRQTGANRFLASFCPFLKKHINHPAIRSVVKSEFTRFIDRNLTPYSASISSSSSPLSLGFIGSIAAHFSDILEECCLINGYSAPLILQSPMSGLIDYHI